MKTTLNKIREHGPCASGWKKLLHGLNKTQADDDELSITTIIDSNGLDDALWCLRAVDGHDKEIRLYAVWCARQVQHLMTDPRSLAALDVAEAYANGLATQTDLDDARAAAGDASSAAWAAAWVAAKDVASSAAWAAAGEATRVAAMAARDAVLAADVEAADDAASAASAARAAAGSASSDAVRDAAAAVQEKKLREICE